VKAGRSEGPKNQEAAQEYVKAGKGWVVDIDLKAFFDQVNHDKLMNLADNVAIWAISDFDQKHQEGDSILSVLGF
jgi:hypothetical protein